MKAAPSIALLLFFLAVANLPASGWAAQVATGASEGQVRNGQVKSPNRQQNPRETNHTRIPHSVNRSKRVRRFYGEKRTQLTRKDLLVAIPSTSARLPLVHGSRVWRRNVPTFIITETGSDAIALTRQAASEGEPLERYGEWREASACKKAGDVRAGVTPFLAAHLRGYDNFKWMLYGDDDTVFFVDNALDMLEELDHNMPYFLTDHLWFPDQFDGQPVEAHRKMHPNRSAPRCLPCGYHDPLHAPNGTSNHVPKGSYKAPEGCPCTIETLCRAAENPGYWGPECEWLKASYPGMWYFEHGGAGAILSVGLFRHPKLKWAKMEQLFNVDGGVSGDAQFMAAVYQEAALLPTDPGYGFYRPQVTLFDPGWRGEQTKGPEDSEWGVVDLGNDPTTIVERLQNSLSEGYCGKDCEDSLQHMLTTHIRARYLAGQVSPNSVQSGAGAFVEEQQATVRLQHKLASLFQRYIEQKGLQRG
ncbi:hypothetical protein WJX82_007212 [Trebouxia sp. C0006]